MGSYNDGKEELCGFIMDKVPLYASILDVGACDGKIKRMLPEYKNMDAVDVWQPHVEAVRFLYRKAYLKNIVDFKYDYYDVVLFLDVIEHLSVEDAQNVLEYAEKHSGLIIVSVPFLYKQGKMYGNKYERHIQDDLTFELFNERYPGYNVLVYPREDYCYYYKNTQMYCKK